MCKSILLTSASDNEKYYLDEWLKYHLKIGFSRIVIFEHNWSFTNKDDYKNDPVEFIPYTKNFIVNNDFDYKNFDNFENSLIHDYISRDQDWDLITNFDCDEFLWFEKYNSFDDFYESNKNNPVVFVKWRHFGDNGLKTFDRNNTSVLKRFTKCSKGFQENGKSFITRHGWECGCRWISAHNTHIGSKIFNHKFYIDYGAELFHFRNKSKEECELRTRANVSKSHYDKCNCNEIDNFKARDFLYGM